MKKLLFGIAIFLLVLGNATLFAQENNGPQRTYHLLILERTYCALNSDISGMDNVEVIYKFNHGDNGYLFAIYTYVQDGSVLPQIPDGSRVLVNLMSVSRNTLEEFIHSDACKRFVTRQSIITGMLEALSGK